MAFKASVLIQRWYRRYMARLEMRRRCTWNIFQSIEYAGQQDQVKLHDFFSYLVDHFTPSSHHESEYELPCDMVCCLNIIVYGFTKEVMHKYKIHGKKILRTLQDVFCWLPLATLVDEKVLVLHGGVSDRTDLELLAKLDRHKAYKACRSCSIPCSSGSVDHKEQSRRQVRRSVDLELERCRQQAGFPGIKEKREPLPWAPDDADCDADAGEVLEPTPEEWKQVSVANCCF
ncbi:serine/threonine-protein phosphatase with EF-hands 2 [Cricetulus griseus]|nr:serine/threonine-protein phosphatase with EF-hands 2 [Cricetulus griseus]